MTNENPRGIPSNIDDDIIVRNIKYVARYQRPVPNKDPADAVCDHEGVPGDGDGNDVA